MAGYPIGVKKRRLFFQNLAVARTNMRESNLRLRYKKSIHQQNEESPLSLDAAAAAHA